MQSVAAAAAKAVVAPALRALRDSDRDDARVFASWTSALSASSLVKPSGSSCLSERILPGTIVELGFSVGVHFRKRSFTPGVAGDGAFDGVVDGTELAEAGDTTSVVDDGELTEGGGETSVVDDGEDGVVIDAVGGFVGDAVVLLGADPSVGCTSVVGAADVVEGAASAVSTPVTMSEAAMAIVPSARAALP